MVATETKTDFIGFSSDIKKEGREGSIQVFTNAERAVKSPGRTGAGKIILA
ncbi:MAG: hypothetical protein NC489_21425 [Ruminococcus flavefaciens]|nr:hypothetical protein [Ruminococcus flavefaciens]